MKQYEYRIEKKFFPSESALNNLGREGWIFCGTVPAEGNAGKAYRYYVFRRRITKPTDSGELVKHGG